MEIWKFCASLCLLTLIVIILVYRPKAASCAYKGMIIFIWVLAMGVDAIYVTYPGLKEAVPGSDLYIGNAIVTNLLPVLLLMFLNDLMSIWVKETDGKMKYRIPIVLGIGFSGLLFFFCYATSKEQNIPVVLLMPLILGIFAECIQRKAQDKYNIKLGDQEGESK